MLGLETLEDPLRGVPLLRRRRLVRLQDRVDHWNQRPELRLLRLVRALISRRRREPAHLVDRVPAQAEHPRCFPPALTLNKNELPNRGIGFHGVHPRPTLPNRKRSAYPLAGFCSATQQHPAAAPVADYSTAADKPPTCPKVARPARFRHHALRGNRLRIRNRFYLMAHLLAGMPQIIGLLHVDPQIRAVTAELAQSQRHLGGDARLLRQDSMHLLARDAKMPRYFGHAHPQRGQYRIPEDRTGMRRGPIGTTCGEFLSHVKSIYCW